MSTKPFDWREHLKVHPAAELFPLMSQDELRALADDISANGMLSFAVSDKDGNLLDGRNRLDALALLGALEAAPGGGVRIKGGQGNPLRWRILGDGDPYDQVLSLNIHRRHLTPEQKRELIAKVPEGKARAVESDDRQAGESRRQDSRQCPAGPGV